MDEFTAALTQMPTCSVCIANYNGERMLSDCINSVLSQGHAHVIEIIVHDDASNDGSVALLQTAYPQVQLLQSEKNVGFCVANNRMVAQARGEFVLLLNNDAALFPDALATLINTARSCGAPAILTLPQYDWRSGELIDRGCLLDPFYNPVPNLDPIRTDVAMAIGACLFLPRSLWSQLGGFPEWMESVAEDLYLCCVARLRGHDVIALRDSGYRHHRGASFSGKRDDASKLVTTYRRRRLSERNKTATLFVCTPTTLMWPLLALHMLSLLVEGIAVSVWRLDPCILSRIYLAALTSLIENFSALSTARKERQAAPRIKARKYFAPFTCLPRKVALLARFGIPRITP